MSIDEHHILRAYQMLIFKYESILNIEYTPIIYTVKDQRRLEEFFKQELTIDADPYLFEHIVNCETDKFEDWVVEVQKKYLNLKDEDSPFATPFRHAALKYIHTKTAEWIREQIELIIEETSTLSK